MRIWCILLLTTLLLGMLAPTGTSWEAEETVICRSISEDNCPLGTTNTFLDTDEYLIFWTRLSRQPDENITCVDEFYAPEGLLYGRPETPLPPDHDILWTTLYIRGYEAAEHPGIWTVRRYMNDVLIFENNFTIEYTRPKLRMLNRGALSGGSRHRGRRG